MTEDAGAQPQETDPLLRGIRTRALFDKIKESPEAFALPENRAELEVIVSAMRLARERFQEAEEAGTKKKGARGPKKKGEPEPTEVSDLSFLTE